MQVNVSLHLTMGNLFRKKTSNVTLLSVKHRHTDSSRSSSQRSKLRTSSSRTSFKEWSPFPTDITIVTLHGSDILVVADYANKTIKTFSPRGNRELFIDGIPYRMARTTSDTIAVTCPLSQEIKVISIAEMSVLDVIQTAKMYNGITSIPKVKRTLAVGSLRDEPGSVDLIDMSGNTLKSFIHDRFGKQLFITPSFVSATPSGDILISDHSMHSLTCLSQKGEVRWQHQPHKGDDFLEDPVGVACHDGENIFLVDRLKRCVFRFTAYGWCFGPVVQLNDELCEPFSICTDKHKTIFIALDDGNIQVYPDGEGSSIKTVIELPKRPDGRKGHSAFDRPYPRVSESVAAVSMSCHRNGSIGRMGDG